MDAQTIADCQSSLLDYTRYMVHQRTGAAMRDNWHQRLICEELERVVLGDTTRLIINVPPRSGKTMMAVEMFISWCMGNWPQSHFIHSSYSGRLAATNTANVRGIMQTDGYHAVFPTRLDQNSRARDEFYTEEGGVVFAAGAGGTITGRGAGGIGEQFRGAIVIDDALKPDEAASDIVRDGVNEWFQNTIESRKNNPRTPIIVIGQRLHEADLPGWLLAGGNGEQWRHIVIPGLDDNGESFWPYQFPVEMLERMRKTNPYVFAGQYMQRPTPIGGGDFKPANINLVNAAPNDLRWVRGWDLAGTTKQTSDFTASVKMARDANGNVWIADVQNFKESPEGVERNIVQTARLDKPNKQSLPRDPGQAGIAQEKSLSKSLSGIHFEFTPESGDKRTRAMPFAAQVNAGNVMMVESENTRAYMHQLESFPNGAHDDMVDASSRAYNAIITAPGPAVQKMGRLK